MMDALRLHFRRRHRLSRDRDYRAVFEARVRKHAGPLTVFALPNGLDHPRLGLSVGRRVGGAVTRNAIKRRLREAFRHLQHRPELQGLDLVVTVRPHRVESGERAAEWYRGHLLRAAGKLRSEWEKRGAPEPDNRAG